MKKRGEGCEEILLFMMPPKRRGTKRKRSDSIVEAAQPETSNSASEGRNSREESRGTATSERRDQRTNDANETGGNQSPEGRNTVSSNNSDADNTTQRETDSNGSGGQPGTTTGDPGGELSPLTRADIPGLVREIARQLRTDSPQPQATLVPGMSVK